MMKLSTDQLEKLPYLPKYDAMEGWELLLTFCREFQEVTNINAYQYLQTIWGYSKPNHIYSFTRPDGNAWTYEHALLIHKFTGVDWFARWMAHQNRLLVRGQLDQTPATSLIETVKECADVAVVTAEMLRDGVITKREYERAKAEITEALESLNGLRESLEMRMEEK